MHNFAGHQEATSNVLFILKIYDEEKLEAENVSHFLGWKNDWNDESK